MKTRAAVLWGPGEDWKIEEIELDDPGPGEVLVKTKAAGLCHSDEHVVTGDMPGARHYPFIGGHEGAGEVIEVGEGVTSGGAGRPRVDVVHPVVRPLPVLRDRPVQTCATSAPALRPRHDHRRPRRPPLQRRGRRPLRPARHVQRAHARGRDLGHQGRRRPADGARCALVSCGVATGCGSAVAPGRRRAGRHGRRDRHRRHRHQRRAGRQDGRRQARSSPSTPSSSSGRRRWSSAPPTPTRRSTRPWRPVGELTWGEMAEQDDPDARRHERRPDRPRP